MQITDFVRNILQSLPLLEKATISPQKKKVQHHIYILHANLSFLPNLDIQNHTSVVSELSVLHQSTSLTLTLKGSYDVPSPLPAQPVIATMADYYIMATLKRKIKHSFKFVSMLTGFVSIGLLVFIKDVISTDENSWKPEGEGYIVNSNKCKIPNYPAFTEDALTYFIPQNYTPCTINELLTYTTVVNNTATLHIRQDLIPKYSTIGEFECCYAYIKRNGTEEEPDVGIEVSPCIPFIKSIALESEIVMVRCTNEYYMTVYENVHRPITIPPEIQTRLQKPNSEKPISVLLVVIDSVSRLNLIRTMGKTRSFLLENNFVELKGYNKINDNTFPNFIAFLTGYNSNQAYKLCDPRTVDGLYKCPMIWKKFRDFGYVTAYAEDWATLNTFNYVKKGFSKPPTDYYFKPYFEAADMLLILEKDTMPYCTGPETDGERTLNLARDFTSTFKNHPTFGIFWMNTFSHNYINSPSGMDEVVKMFYEDLKTNGILNESVVIFLSDHGIRFGPFRKSRPGWFEERLPLNLISVPPWFQNEFPVEYNNLKKNAEKLTNTFDLYMTLQHILVLSGMNHTLEPSMACIHCTSLFSEIPADRSCVEAGIPEQWCTCIGYLKPVGLDSVLAIASTTYIRPILEQKLLKQLPFLRTVTASISEYNNILVLIVAASPVDFYYYQFTLKISSIDYGYSFQILDLRILY